MKKTLYSFLAIFAFFSVAEACPYQKMADVDSKLFSPNNTIDTKTFAKISNLRIQGEKELNTGNLDDAEQIFDRALALFKNK